MTPLGIKFTLSNFVPSGPILKIVQKSPIYIFVMKLYFLFLFFAKSPSISLPLMVSNFLMVLTHVSGWYQDGNTSSRTITEVKLLELSQFSVGWNFLVTVSAAVEQSNCKAKIVAHIDGKFGPWGWHTIIPKKAKPSLSNAVFLT